MTDRVEYTVYSKTYNLVLAGDREEDIDEACDATEYDSFGKAEEAIAYAKKLQAEPENVALNRTGDGFGSISHELIWVDAYRFDARADEWVQVGPDGSDITDGWSESICIHDCLEDRPDLKTAWDKAVKSKWDFLDYRSDSFGGVYDFLGKDDD